MEEKDSDIKMAFWIVVFLIIIVLSVFTTTELILTVFKDTFPFVYKLIFGYRAL